MQSYKEGANDLSVESPKKRSFHVLIVGGGIAGLSLAQALKRRGISFEVFERDQSITERLQGYRFSMMVTGENAGEVALEHILEQQLFETYQKTVGFGGTTLTFVDAYSLKEIVQFGEKNTKTLFARSVSRTHFRNHILMEGLQLGTQLHLGKRFSEFSVTNDAQGATKVVAKFEDGSTHEGDILVGAEGANSAVRRQLLPYAQRVDTGVYAITGKVRWNPKLRSLIQSTPLATGAMKAFASNGWIFFCATHQFQEGQHREEREEKQHLPEDDEEFLWRDDVPYLFWSINAPKGRFTKFDPEAMRNPVPPSLLFEQALEVVDQGSAPWHPVIREIIKSTIQPTMMLLNIRTSIPIDPWRTTVSSGSPRDVSALPVTLIGDAIHSMTPYRGIGANTALTDSWKLADQLLEVQEGRKELLQALSDYEVEMCSRAFKAVRESKQSLEMAHLEGWFSTTLRNIVLRGLNILMHPRHALLGD